MLILGLAPCAPTVEGGRSTSREKRSRPAVTRGSRLETEMNNETTTAAARCACGNATTDLLANGTSACEWCAGHDACALPRNITINRSQFTGTQIAECGACNFKSAHWYCACELEHGCWGDCPVEWTRTQNVYWFGNSFVDYAETTAGTFAVLHDVDDPHTTGSGATLYVRTPARWAIVRWYSTPSNARRSVEARHARGK